MNRTCFFTKTTCANTDDCTFWDEDRNTCKLYNRFNIETATNDKIELNSNTFTKIKDSNLSRNGLILCSTSTEGDNKHVIVSLSSVEDAIDGAGYYLRDGQKWEVPHGYTGEVCGKADINNPVITYIEW
jgi:hypothetical protein